MKCAKTFFSASLWLCLFFVPVSLISQADTSSTKGLTKEKFYSNRLADPANVNSILKRIDGSDLASVVTKTYVVGSFFIDEEFQDGRVMDRQDRTEDVKLRYSIKEDQIQVLKNGKIIVLNPLLIKAALIGNRIFIQGEVKSGNQVQVQYFELLAEGEISLLKRYNYVLRRADSQQFHTKKVDHDEIIVTEKLYYQINSEVAMKLKKKKKEILNLLSARSEEVAQFVKEKDIQFNKENDLIRLFEFYNK